MSMNSPHDKPAFWQHPLRRLLILTPLQSRGLTLLLAALLAGLACLLFRPALHTVEERLGALGWVLSAEETVEQRLTLVVIDEQSLAEVGPWPWPRQTMAELVTAIDDTGAQLQLHDVVYSEPRSGDEALIDALQSARGPVLAHVPVLNPNAAVQVGMMTHALSGVNCNAVNAGGQLAASGSFLAPHAGFAAIPKGHITPIIDSDGAIRSTPALICVQGQAYPALALTALLQATNSADWAVSLTPGGSLLAPAQELRLDSYPGLVIPLDGAGNMRISYRTAPDSFRAVSAGDVLAGRADPAMLANTWVLVGATAFGMGDIVPTPYSGATPGVEVQARLLTSLLDTDIPYTPRGAWLYLALLSLAFAALLGRMAGASDRVVAYGLPAAAAGLPLLAMAVHVQVLAVSPLWLGWMYPALYGPCAASLLLLLEQRRVRSERSRVFSNLNSYLPSEFAHEIAFSLPSSTIKARRCDVTLLSADLRNFSAFGESQPAEESAAILHFFFVRATAIIERHGGRIHEFKGDGLLAVWDGQGTEAATRAYEAAREMQSALPEELLTRRAPAGLEPLALGIGIEQGPALIGAIGPAQRRTLTLLGDTVTITLRIQELTADLAQPILIGECAARQLSAVGLESQGSYLLKGLRTPHTLFAPRPAASEEKPQPRLQVVSGGRR